MAFTNAKAAQHWHAGGPRKTDHLLAGVICSEDISATPPSQQKTPTDLQVSRLTQRFAVSVSLAYAIAGLAYECGVQR